MMETNTNRLNDKLQELIFDFFSFHIGIHRKTDAHICVSCKTYSYAVNLYCDDNITAISTSGIV